MASVVLKRENYFLGTPSEGTCSEHFLTQILERIICSSFVSFLEAFLRRNFCIKYCFSSGEAGCLVIQIKVYIAEYFLTLQTENKK